MTDSPVPQRTTWILLAAIIALGVVASLFLLTGTNPLDLLSPPEPLPTIDPSQSILFHNGIILTMNPDQPQATALAVAGDRIVAVGDDETILALRQPDSRVIDLAGRTLMPGFVDAHTHLLNDAERYFDMSLAEVQQLALENGITTIGDLYVNPGDLRDIQRLNDRGQLRLRTSLYLIASDNCGQPQDDWWRDHPPARPAGELLWLNGIKIFADGGTCGRPALSYELRPGEGLGDLFFEPADLNSLVADAGAAGYQVAIHAIGDRAVEQAQNAIAAALDGGPNAGRHRIEHNSVIRPDLLARYGEIGIIPVIFGQYPVCDPFGPPPPAEFQSWEWPWPALLAANPGLPVAWHGDDPYFGRVRPLDDLYSLVTRDEIGPDGEICAAPAWQDQHRLTVEQALPLMTTNAAYALFRDEAVGQLTPGRYADLIVLTANPLAVDPDALPGLGVLLTVVGGRVEYCEEPDLCP